MAFIGSPETTIHARWEDRLSVFSQHLQDCRSNEQLFDCTLACEGEIFHAHRLILSMSSQFFQDIFESKLTSTSVILVAFMKAKHLEKILEYIYTGETSIPHDQLEIISKIAEDLKLKGFPSIKTEYELVIPKCSSDVAISVTSDLPSPVLSSTSSSSGYSSPSSSPTQLKRKKEDEKKEKKELVKSQSLKQVFSPPRTSSPDYNINEFSNLISSTPVKETNRLTISKNLMNNNNNNNNNINNIEKEGSICLPNQIRISWPTSEVENGNSTSEDRNLVRSDSAHSSILNYSNNKSKKHSPAVHKSFLDLVNPNSSPTDNHQSVDSEIDIKMEDVFRTKDDTYSAAYSDFPTSEYMPSITIPTQETELELSNNYKNSKSNQRIFKTFDNHEESNQIKNTENSNLKRLLSEFTDYSTVPSQKPYDLSIKTRTLSPPNSPVHLRTPPPLLKLTKTNHSEVFRDEKAQKISQSSPHYRSHLLVSPSPTLQRHFTNNGVYHHPQPYDHHQFSHGFHSKSVPKINDITTENDNDDIPTVLPGQNLQASNEKTCKSDPMLTKIPTNKRKRVRGPKCWEFLLRLLRDPTTNPSLIRWENKNAGIFRLIKPTIIAQRWGRRTGKHSNDHLTYENFARGLRYHYATGALTAVSEKSFVYSFGPTAEKALNGMEDVPMLNNI